MILYAVIKPAPTMGRLKLIRNRANIELLPLRYSNYIGEI